MITGALAQDGPRAFHLVPEDTKFISLTTTFLHSESDAGVFDVGVLTPAYRHTFDVFGNMGGILIGIPIGSLSASLNTQIGIIDMETDPAQGDLFVGGYLGLIGSPSLSPIEFAQYKPGFRAGVAAKLYLPTGDYDPDRLLNLGGNRWSLHAAVPISYVLADTMLDPNLTTFEIVPSVQIFGDNDDPSLTGVTSQEPLWRVDGHVTRNFGPTVWASLDGSFVFGGETSSGGVPNSDAQETLAVGATLGLVLNPSVSLRLSYEETIHSNVPNSSARGFKGTVAYRY